MAGTPDPPAAAPTPRGRRRAGSRHRRVRRVPPPGAAVLRLGVPAAVLVLLAGLVTVAWAAGDRTGPVPGPVTLAAVLTAMTLLFAIARRAGLSLLAALLAAALSATYPPVVVAARAGVPEHLAVVALLTSVLLLLVRGRRRIVTPLAAVAAGLAVALSPLALAAAPFLAAQAASSLGRRRRRPTILLAVALFIATMAAGWVVFGVDPSVTPVAGAALVLAWLRDAPVAVAVSGGALVLGILSPRLRPVAGYAIVLLALSIWPDGDEVDRHTILIAPALALLTGATAEWAMHALRRSALRPRLIGAVAAAAVAAGLVAAVTASVLEAQEETTSSRTVPPAPRVTESSVPSETPSGSPPETPSATPSEAPSRSPSAPGQADRAALGAQLVRNPRLTLAPRAAELLTDGAVDRRIPVVLAQLLSRHDLVVADFPAQPGEDASVRRQVLIQQMDGQPLRTQGTAMTTISAFLAALTGDFAVETISESDDGVLATFPPLPRE